MSDFHRILPELKNILGEAFVFVDDESRNN